MRRADKLFDLITKWEREKRTETEIVSKFSEMLNEESQDIDLYFDINDAVLIGEKQQLIFEKSDIKEIRLAQFETNPNKIVRAVITFEEGFDTSKVKLLSVDGNIIVKISNLPLKNDYFNVIYFTLRLYFHQ